MEGLPYPAWHLLAIPHCCHVNNSPISLKFLWMQESSPLTEFTFIILLPVQGQCVPNYAMNCSSVPKPTDADGAAGGHGHPSNIPKVSNFPFSSSGHPFNEGYLTTEEALCKTTLYCKSPGKLCGGVTSIFPACEHSLPVPGLLDSYTSPSPHFTNSDPTEGTFRCSRKDEILPQQHLSPFHTDWGQLYGKGPPCMQMAGENLGFY